MEERRKEVNGEKVLGTIKWFDAAKGFGFIDSPAVEGDVYVHYSNILGEGYRKLSAGDVVEFRTWSSAMGLRAVEVRSLGHGRLEEYNLAAKIVWNDGEVTHVDADGQMWMEPSWMLIYTQEGELVILARKPVFTFLAICSEQDQNWQYSLGIATLASVKGTKGEWYRLHLPNGTLVRESFGIFTHRTGKVKIIDPPAPTWVFVPED